MGIIYAAPEVDDGWTHFPENLPQNCPQMLFLKGSPSSAPITLATWSPELVWGTTRMQTKLGAMAVNKIKQLHYPEKNVKDAIPDSAIILPKLIVRQSTLRV